MRVVLGVSGGIAAYKACSLLRLFTEQGHDVTVVPTAAALNFVGAPTWAALSGKPVATDVWTGVDRVDHVRIGQQADLVVVAPATADLLARAATGQANDLLTATLLTATCPVVFAPAMHTEMWLHPATQANVATLRSRGAIIVPPASGRLTGADSGPGRLPEPQDLYAAALAAAEGSPARTKGTSAAVSTPPAPAGGVLSGVRVVVTAGGTREPLDPVRYLGNRSSGKQGYALAAVAAERGAEVTLIAANVALPDPAGVQVHRVETALELEAAVSAAATDTDVVVMCAAVADFRPKHYVSMFTSESVTEGHPDKLCDNVSDAILDAHLAAGPHARVACETMVKTGFVVVAGEITTHATWTTRTIVREVVRDIGYTDSDMGFDGNTCAILTRSSSSRPDIARASPRARASTRSRAPATRA
jgi:phosphopantothenoylcysteine decarboxylase/phosphopantothenate--cysteine ligase